MMSNFHFETEFRYIFFKKFLQRRTRPQKFSKLKDALWCLWAIFAKYHIICSLLRIPLDRLAGMPKGAFTALHSTAACLCNITRRVMDIRRVQQGKVYLFLIVRQFKKFVSCDMLVLKSLHRSHPGSHFYGTQYEILADFWLVNNTEKKSFVLIMSNF